MIDNQASLDIALQAEDVNPVHEIRASDGKNYLCRRIKEIKLTRGSLYSEPSIGRDQKRRKRGELLKDLTREGIPLSEVIIHQREIKGLIPNDREDGAGDAGPAHTCHFVTYAIAAYRIIRRL